MVVLGLLRCPWEVLFLRCCFGFMKSAVAFGKGVVGWVEGVCRVGTAISARFPNCRRILKLVCLKTCNLADAPLKVALSQEISFAQSAPSSHWISHDDVRLQIRLSYLSTADLFIWLWVNKKVPKKPHWLKKKSIQTCDL